MGSLTLDFLAKYRTDKIRTWLEQFPGVGPKTGIGCSGEFFDAAAARAVCRQPITCVSFSGCALCRARTPPPTEERLMRLEPETWDAAMLDEHHALVKLHAQTMCTANDPKCENCPLLKICPTGQRNVAELKIS